MYFRVSYFEIRSSSSAPANYSSSRYLSQILGFASLSISANGECNVSLKNRRRFRLARGCKAHKQAERIVRAIYDAQPNSFLEDIWQLRPSGGTTRRSQHAEEATLGRAEYFRAEAVGGRLEDGRHLPQAGRQPGDLLHVEKEYAGLACRKCVDYVTCARRTVG